MHDIFRALEEQEEQSFQAGVKNVLGFRYMINQRSWKNHDKIVEEKLQKVKLMHCFELIVVGDSNTWD